MYVAERPLRCAAGQAFTGRRCTAVRIPCSRACVKGSVLTNDNDEGMKPQERHRRWRSRSPQWPHDSVEANRRPAAPPEAGAQFGSPFSARSRPCGPAVAHLGSERAGGFGGNGPVETGSRRAGEGDQVVRTPRAPPQVASSPVSAPPPDSRVGSKHLRQPKGSSSALPLPTTLPRAPPRWEYVHDGKVSIPGS